MLTAETCLKHYRINEIFYSIQGEGFHAGRAAIFVRFTGCNLRCAMAEGLLSPGGFNCDTEFTSGRTMIASEIADEARRLAPDCNWLIATGGEPLLQLDAMLIGALHASGFKVAVETNGTQSIPDGIDWITLSPKVAEHAVVPAKVDELKYVRGTGQAIPKPAALADHYYISPAFDGDRPDPAAITHCVRLIKENPSWRLTLQLHKLLMVR